jgi:hypothetical protein
MISQKIQNLITSWKINIIKFIKINCAKFISTLINSYLKQLKIKYNKIFNGYVQSNIFFGKGVQSNICT